MTEQDIKEKEWVDNNERKHCFSTNELNELCQRLREEERKKVLMGCKFSSDNNYYYATKEEILNP